MAKYGYASMKLKTDNSTMPLNFKDVDEELVNKYKDMPITVQKYLSMSDKYDLVMITLQKSKEGGIYNPIKIDMYFHLHLIYMYTNLSFTENQKEDEAKIYDNLKSNGFIDIFLNTIDENEYEDLWSYLNEQMELDMKYNSTIAGVINNFIEDLPKNAEAAKDIVENFDKEKFQEVINFAQAANGGRPITD